MYIIEMNYYNKNVSMEKKNYLFVDIMKLFFAVGVVMIHTQLIRQIFSERTAWVVEHIYLRLAVPFFFVVTGYFVGEKLYKGKNKWNIYKEYCLKLLPPLFVWGTINLPFDIKRYYGDASLWEVVIYCLKTYLFHPAGYMWFIWSCIISLTIICAFWNWKKRTTILALIAIGIYVFILLCDSYNFIVYEPHIMKFIRYFYKCFISIRMLYGIPFMIIGIYINKIIKLKGNTQKTLGVLIVVFLIITFVEMKIVYGKELLYNSEMLISYIMLVPLLVMLCLRLSFESTKVSLECRKVSTGIYYTHGLVLEIVSLYVQNPIIKFVSVLFISMCLTYILRKGKITRRLV